MPEDFRVEFGFFDHPKTVMLKSKLGDEGVICLMRLWEFAGRHRTKGVLYRMDSQQIAIAAHWNGDPHQFIGTLLEVRFLDKHKRGVFALHKWKTHQGYLWYSDERREQARIAAKAKHDKRRKELARAETGYEDIEEQKSCDAGRTTPIPTPTPVPDPSPDPKSIATDEPPPSVQSRQRKSRKESSGEHQQTIAYFCQRYQDKIGSPYLVKGGKDGKAIQALLHTFGAKKLRELIDCLLETDDQFIDKTDRGIGILWSQANKLAQIIEDGGETDPTKRAVARFLEREEREKQKQ